MNRNDPARYDADIQRALATRGGPLSIGRGGFALHFENVRLEGYDCDAIKAAAIAAGLPVIDSRSAPFELHRQARRERSDGGSECSSRSAPVACALLCTARSRCRSIPEGRSRGFHIPESSEHAAVFHEMLAGPLADLLDAWLQHVRAHGE
jgi:hypothetical protein